MSLSKPTLNKRKHKALSLHDKLCVIEKLEKGASVASICVEYGIANQTVSDIRKKKDDLRKFVLKFNVEKEKSVVKRMRINPWTMPNTNGFLSFVRLDWL